ncbi:hypothetical protein ACN47E_005369 [Coniothyrium glycines]
MEDTIIARLAAVPWAAALINDPQWTPTGTSSRKPKASHEDSFFAETLATDRTMRAVLTLRPKEAKNDDLVYWEVKTLVEVGDGINGYPRIAHGGFVATLLDEVCGILIVLNVEAKAKRMRELGQAKDAAAMNYFTAYLNITYRRPVPTPGVLLCTARIERREGRKVFVYSTVEDGKGTVYTTGEGMFLATRSKI